MSKEIDLSTVPTSELLYVKGLPTEHLYDSNGMRLGPVIVPAIVKEMERRSASRREKTDSKIIEHPSDDTE